MTTSKTSGKVKNKNNDKTKSAKAAKKKQASERKKQAEAKSDTAKAAETKVDAGEEEPPVVDDRFLRLQADFENYRRRVLREKDELYRRANEDLMEELLPVLDHLELAFSSTGEAHKHDPVVEGFRLVADQLMNALGKFGLTPIETEGQAFDPNVHEAILHMPSDDVDENYIISQARGGYKLGERLLRASQVVVSSGPSAETSPADSLESEEA